MTTLESQYVPMNGLELNKAIKNQLGIRVDKMYLLKQGNSFHRARIIGKFSVECFPKDVPVPEIDFDFAISAASMSSEEVQNGLIKIDELKAKRDKLKGALEKIEATLNTVAPTEEISFDENTIDANGKDTPDKMRLDNNLPIPMIKRDKGSVTEVMVPAKDVKVA